MGTRGPMPKRSEERSRRNKEQEDGLTLKKGEALPTSWPRAASEWDDAIKKLYASFKKSGMAAFYQQSDIQWIWMACDEMNEYRQDPRRSAMKLQAVLSMFSSGLGVTEGDRRRMQIELDEPAEEEDVESEDDKVASMMDRLNQANTA